MVRFAEAAAELGVRTVFGAELSLGLTAPQNGVADPEGSHLLLLARDPDGYRAAVPHDQRRPARRAGEGAPRLRPRRRSSPTRPGTCSCSPGAARARCGRRWTAGGAGRRPRALRGLVGAVRAGQRGRRAHRRRRCPRTPSATTPWPGSPPTPGCRRSPARPRTTPCRSGSRWPPRWPRSGPGAAWTRSTVGCRPRAPRTCAPARRWRPGSPRHPGAVARAAEFGAECAFALDLVAPDLPPFATPPGRTETTWLRELTRRGVLERYGSYAECPEAVARWSRSWRSSRPGGFPGYFLIVYDIVDVLPRVGHPLPGPRLGGQLRGLLRARDHQRRRGVARSAVRAVPVPGARRLPGHRPRHRVRPPRGGHPVRLQPLRARPGGPGRQRDHLPAAVGGARRRQGARVLARASRTRGASRSSAGTALEGGERRRASPRRSGSWPNQLLGFPRHLGIHSGGMVICDRPVAEVVPGRVGPDGRPHGRAVGQGRLRVGRAGEVRPARAGHAHRTAPDDRPRRGAPRPRDRAARAAAGRPRGLRDARAGRLGRGVPGRVPRADGHAAAAAAARVLRPGRRGRADPARPDPGRLGAPLHPAPQRSGEVEARPPAAQERRWTRPSACRCSRSS